MRKSALDPARATVGDVATAMFQVDSRLRQLHGDPVHESREYRHELARAFKTADPEQVVDGFCTLLYLLMKWLGEACETTGKDVAEEVVPYTVRCLTQMTRNIEREAVPTMGGMLVACTLGLSPTLWRRQYGPWTRGELTALEATAVLLAEQVNCWAGDPEAAGRLVLGALDEAHEQNGEEVR
ncbi:hypothetical protein [Thermomonospora umbrina]|uniref:Uncharacterized protein n=1 Tax=Thermomonospora umbrina TaxID=111806 RepID=A0A3D9T4F8_9ACTN|nr:hypothetical protein [Thermomonospora umbrina]REE98701.1 hypothetical protein DFJ69_4194 [Thermomonospora umbrina]